MLCQRKSFRPFLRARMHKTTQVNIKQGIDSLLRFYLLFEGSCLVRVFCLRRLIWVVLGLEEKTSLHSGTLDRQEMEYLRIQEIFHFNKEEVAAFELLLIQCR